MTVMPPTGGECRPGVRAMCPEPQIAMRGGRRADVQYAKVMFSAVKDSVSQTLFIFFMTVGRQNLFSEGMQAEDGYGADGEIHCSSMVTLLSLSCNTIGVILQP